MSLIPSSAAVKALRVIPRAKQSSSADHNELMRTFSALTSTSRDAVNRLSNGSGAKFGEALMSSLVTNFEGYLPALVTLGAYILQRKLKGAWDATQGVRNMEEASLDQSEFSHWQMLLRLLQNKTLDALDEVQLALPLPKPIHTMLISAFIPHMMQVLLVASEYPQLVPTRTVETCAMSFMDLVRILGSKDPSHRAAKLLSPEALGRLLLYCKDVDALKHLIALTHFLRPDKTEHWPAHFRRVFSFWDGGSFPLTLGVQKNLLVPLQGTVQLGPPRNDALTRKKACMAIFEGLKSSEKSFEAAALRLAREFQVLQEGQAVCLPIAVKGQNGELWIQHRVAVLTLFSNGEEARVYSTEWANVESLTLDTRLRVKSGPWEAWGDTDPLEVDEIVLTGERAKVREALLSFECPRRLMQPTIKTRAGHSFTVPLDSNKGNVQHAAESNRRKVDLDNTIRSPAKSADSSGHCGHTTLPTHEEDTNLHFFPEEPIEEPNVLRPPSPNVSPSPRKTNLVASPLRQNRPVRVAGKKAMLAMQASTISDDRISPLSEPSLPDSDQANSCPSSVSADTQETQVPKPDHILRLQENNKSPLGFNAQSHIPPFNAPSRLAQCNRPSKRPAEEKLSPRGKQARGRKSITRPFYFDAKTLASPLYLASPTGRGASRPGPSREAWIAPRREAPRDDIVSRDHGERESDHFPDLFRSLAFASESIYTYLQYKILTRQAQSEALLGQFQASVRHEMDQLQALVREAHLAAQSLSRAGKQIDAAYKLTHKREASRVPALREQMEQWALRERAAISALGQVVLE